MTRHKFASQEISTSELPRMLAIKSVVCPILSPKNAKSEAGICNEHRYIVSLS